MKPLIRPSRLRLRILVLSCIALFLIPAVCSNPINLTAADTARNASIQSSGKAEDVFDFPIDHVLHEPKEVVKDSRLFSEWLYWTGVLLDEITGDQYGMQYTLFHMDIKPGSMAYINHAAISDVRNSQHPLYGYSALPGQVNVTNGTDADRGAYWKYSDNQTTLTYWLDRDTWDIKTQGVASIGERNKNISMNLILKNDKMDYYLQTPTGINNQGFCLGVGSEEMAGKSYYYSHPAMNTTGTLTIGERKIHVSGYSWFDHQWGGFRQCYPAWDWFSLRLDDGSYIMLYDLKDPLMKSIPRQRSLTYIDPEGNIQWWHGRDAANITATRWSQSNMKGSRYPLDWILDTPAGKFALEPYFDEQNMDVEGSPISYWEGIMRIRAGDLRGEQIGAGYLEMTGYVPIENLESYFAPRI